MSANPPNPSLTDDLVSTEADRSATAAPGAATAAAEAAEGPPVAAASATAEVEAARAEVLRVRAEMENLRRRLEREMQQARRYAIDGLLSELLPVLDGLEAGLKSAEHEAATVALLREGTALTAGQLRKALASYGVEIIDPVGARFDPDLHQAVATEEAADAVDGAILRVLQTGYRLHDRLIRAALVVVKR